MQRQLLGWVMLVNKSREQSKRNYMELRYEDLIAAPQPTVEQILRMAELDLHDECMRAMSFDYHKSGSKDAWPTIKKKQLREITGLSDLMAEYQYSIPA